MADGKVIIRTALDNSGLEKGLKGVSGKLGGLKTVVSGVAAGMTAAFAAVAVAAGVVAKQSVEAYADYEQLTGGVETLFKDAASKVIGYANDAFYTVGMSANEYMETVTSFSASLIGSLGGDTEKAADVANMALVDMADNAAKMGSDLSSIQAAFQGFAKGQYQLLDNLKLGYGGAKTEMERLLKDAQAITGVKYDIDNLADVYNAIHVIQEKLGIAGTTAKEAEKTISGSAAMTAAAWKNVLSAISGGGDIDRAIDNLVFSLSRYFENIVPVVQRALVGIGRLIEQMAPLIIETVVSSLIQAIPSLISAVHQMIIGAAKGIYQGLAALFSGGSKEVSAQLSEIDASGADKASDSFDAITEAANKTVEASKEAKKNLAGFDEIQKLGADNEAQGETVVPAVISAETTPTVEVPVEVTPQLETTWLQKLLAPLMDIDFGPLQESFAKLEQSVGPLTTSAFDGLKWAYNEILVPLAEWTIEDLLPAFLDMFSAAMEVLNSTIEALQPLWEWLWTNFFEPVAEWTGGLVVSILESITDGLYGLSDWISEHQALVEGIAIAVGAVAASFALVNGAIAICTGVTSAFGAVMAVVTSPITRITLAIGALIAIIAILIRNWESVKEVAKNVWDGIKEIWGSVSTWFKEHLIDPIVDFFKGMVNGIIGFINGIISGLASGVNFVIDALNTLHFDVPSWVPIIGGSSFGFEIPRVKAAQIPYLAKGAVLPPNKPFLAMVGDQTHGTNVEAPLATIQEAVAIVMEDMIRSNIAGHEATVAVLKDILEAVLGIEIGDDVVGAAVSRYNSKLAVIQGR